MDATTETLKVWATVLIFIQTLVSGMVPIYFGRSLLFTARVISIGNCFTAGIFLAMGLSHILYEARESEESLAHYDILSGKLHLHVFIGTFVLIFGIEAIISSDDKMENKSIPVSPVSHQAKDSPRELEEIGSPSLTSTPLQLPLVDDKSEGEGRAKSKEHTFLNFVLIGGAMSVHSVSTGLALGVQRDYNSVLSIMIAIMAHKSIEAIALGFNVSLNVTTLLTQGLLIGGYACFTPAGIIAGMALMADNALLQVVAKAVSAGALFYISTVEIVNEEFIREKPGKSKYAALAAGVLFMTVSTLLFAE